MAGGWSGAVTYRGLTAVSNLSWPPTASGRKPLLLLLLVVVVPLRVLRAPRGAGGLCAQ